jgi:hypothetical protein
MVHLLGQQGGRSVLERRHQLLGHQLSSCKALVGEGDMLQPQLT